MKSRFASRIWIVAAPAMLGPAVVFLLGPYTIYTTNPGEIAVPFRELLMPWLLRAAGLTWLLVVGGGCVLALLSERLTRVYAALLLAFGLLLWGQGHLWNADYGVLTGDDIDLAEHAWRGPYELAAWAGLFLVVVVFSRFVSRIAPFAALTFMGVQLAAAWIINNAEPAAAMDGGWAEPPPSIYRFSTKQNVIHIVLDAFQSDVFAEIMQRDRAMFDRQFSGFEYFAEHAGGFPTTAFNMVAMLTGEEYRNQRPAPEFIREAFKRASILEKVSRAGYAVDVMSIVPLPSLDQWLGPAAAPNWKGARFQIRRPFVSRVEYREASARQLLDVSVFRHAPHRLKAALAQRWNISEGGALTGRQDSRAQVRRYQASNSAAFFEHFTQSMTAEDASPAYKLLHVGIPHRPVVVDRECRFIGVTRVSRASYAEQSRCAINLVAAFLDRLRTLGIYDSSLVIISSDHGSAFRPPGFHGASDSLPNSLGASIARLGGIAGTAKALMLIKPPYRTGSLTISEAPTSHTDLQPTILDLLHFSGAPTEMSMFRRDPRQPRTRTFGMYNLRERFPKAYLSRLDALTIDGPVVDAGSWRLQRSIWRPDIKLDAREVDIGVRSGNAYLGPGWTGGQRESHDGAPVTFARALTRRAVIFASLPPGRSEIVLRAAWAPDRSIRSIGLSVDGGAALGFTLPAGNGYRDLSIEVPAHPNRPAVSQLTLQFDADDRFVFKLDRLSFR